MSWVNTRKYELGKYEVALAGLIRGSMSWVNIRKFELGYSEEE